MRYLTLNPEISERSSHNKRVKDRSWSNSATSYVTLHHGFLPKVVKCSEYSQHHERKNFRARLNPPQVESDTLVTGVQKFLDERNIMMLAPKH